MKSMLLSRGWSKKIHYEIYASEQRLEQKIHYEIYASEQRLEQKINASELNLAAVIVDGFTRSHGFCKARVHALINATSKVKGNCDGINYIITAHTVYYDDYVVTLFSPHMNCTIDIYHDGIILHPIYDLALLPQSKHIAASAINITSGIVPNLGDSVVAYGYGTVASAWAGYISRIAENSCVR